MKKISIQMYSLRELCEKNFMETLEEVAKAGYDAVELAGTYGVEAGVLQGHLQRIGLRVSGAHISLEELKNNIDEVMSYQRKLDNFLLICPYAETERKEDVMKLIQDLNEVNSICEKHGFTLAYHNHANEFNKFDDEYALTMMKNGTPDSLKFELDVYWAHVAGVDVVEYLHTLGKRCVAIHLKDQDKHGKNVEVGTGCVPIEDVLVKAEEMDIHNWVVEQEEFSINPIDSIKMSHSNIVQFATV